MSPHIDAGPRKKLGPRWWVSGLVCILAAPMFAGLVARLFWEAFRFGWHCFSVMPFR